MLSGVLLLIVAAAIAPAGEGDTSMSPSDEPRALPRKDAFFGLHFDLHPQATDTALGADITEEMIARLLDRARPDYVQYDCKGHAGYTGYPTKVGWPSPGIVKDSLAIWRKVTRERGVGLYIHYSGLWDSVAMQHHPEWARVDPSGKPDPDVASAFGPYADELLIPQLKEVTVAYELDGAWVDGECWAARLDYSPAALAAWQRETGRGDAPRDRNDPDWLEWKMLHRRQFERYLCHWVDALHAVNPGLQLTSNWMYTTFAPKPVVAKLDFLSGDYSMTESVDRARVEARYLANTGMPWDLMAWGFNSPPEWGHNLKPAVQLQQEAAVVLMQGGGFQIYYRPTRSGYICDQVVETARQVADFCRARQEVSHKSTSVPQVALLLSSATQWDRSDAVFHPGGCLDELEGALHALLELQYSVDVLAEHQLQPRLREFPLVVVPDSYRLEEPFRQALLAYARDGGSLLLLGQQCARLFPEALGVTMQGEPEQVDAELATPEGFVSVPGPWQRVRLGSAEAVAYRYATHDARRGGEVAATIASCGRGRVAATYGPTARAYFRTHHPALRSLVGDLARRLFPEPAVTVDAPSCVDISLRRTRGGQLSLHLLNLANAQRADRFLSTDCVPPAASIEARLRLACRPRAVHWEPGREALAWTWSEGTLAVSVPRLEIHGVVVVEE